ncbi:MAG: aminotransferase class I/II-fold pyridoxal phosphate-dependent enzyme [Clostridiales bacterium]|nr:aminotransferase class I/II-fold pyridoxal phosphate-dependent enzyme [Clostridiales bacterium]
MLLKDMSKEQLVEFKAQVQKEYEDFKSKGLKLDMSRGKPSSLQLDMSMEILDVINSTSDMNTETGIDCRNYNLVDGIPEAKRLFAEVLGVSTEEIFIGGNSSLNLEYDIIVKNMILGASETSEPWGKLEKIKWLCPCPGYDRHFGICESLGIEMINIPMLDDGPDMDMIEKLVSEDELIKGVWCVPMYSNPTGITFSDKVVKRFAALKPKAKDFRIFWDNAYCVHHLTDTPDTLLSILEECKNCGNDDMVYIFGSTSKITFAGGGVSFVATSKNNINYLRNLINVQTIGYDKVNQLRHARYFKNYDGIKEKMDKHAEEILPKFQVVLDSLEKNIKPLGIGSWHKPNGGYFISFDAMDGCAKRIAELCKEGGVVLTGAGATFPYGIDPRNSNLRIAPTYPPVSELKLAVELFCISTKLASVEKLLEI